MTEPGFGPEPDLLPRTYVVTGAASGIGQATTEHLRGHRHRVITVDRDDAAGTVDVVADLSTAAGRAAAVAGVREQTELVHGVVPAAGVAGLTGVDPQLVASVNYTYTDSDATLPGGRETRLGGQSENVFNAALSYELGPFWTQFSLNYRDDFILEFGGDTGEAKWRVRIDSTAIEANNDPANPYKGVVKSSWFADERPVTARGSQSNLPIELISNGLGQECWAFWKADSKAWSWE